MSEANLLLILLGIALFALFSGPIGRSSLTPPMVFTALGLVMSPVGFGWIDLALDNQIIHIVAEAWCCLPMLPASISSISDRTMIYPCVCWWYMVLLRFQVLMPMPPH